MSIGHYKMIEILITGSKNWLLGQPAFWSLGLPISQYNLYSFIPLKSIKIEEKSLKQSRQKSIKLEMQKSIKQKYSNIMGVRLLHTFILEHLITYLR